MNTRSKARLVLLSSFAAVVAAILFILFLMASKPILIGAGVIRIPPPGGGILFVPSDFQLLFPEVSSIIFYIGCVALVCWMLMPEGLVVMAAAICIYGCFYAVLMLTLPTLDNATGGTILVPDWQMIGAQFRSSIILQLLQIVAGAGVGLLLTRVKRPPAVSR